MASKYFSIKPIQLNDLFFKREYILKKILLIYPPGWIRISPMPPLGIYEIKNILNNNSIYPQCVDLEMLAYFLIHSHNSKIHLDILTKPVNIKDIQLSLNNPKLSNTISCLIDLLSLDKNTLICFSVMGQRQFFSAARISYKLRELGYITCIGGCYTSHNIEIVKSSNAFSYIFHNSAINSFILFCKKFINNNIKYDKQESITYINEKENDIISTPLYDKEIKKLYSNNLKNMYLTATPHLILQHRLDIGCDRSCSFCVRHSMKYKAIDKDQFLKGLLKSYNNTKCNMYSFVTNAININMRNNKKILDEIISAGLDINWYSYATPKRIDYHFLKLMAKSGCKVLRFGLESGSDKILKSMNKRFTVEEAEDVITAAWDFGIWTQVNIIIGYPNEKKQDIDLTCEFINRNHSKIDSIRINPFYLQIGSDITENPKKYSINIRQLNGSKIVFDEIVGMPFQQKKEFTINSIDKIYRVMKSHDIGYTGILINLLLTAIVENKTKDDTKLWFKNNYPFMFENFSLEAIRWKIYRRHELNKNPFGNNWPEYYGFTFEEKTF